MLYCNHVAAIMLGLVMDMGTRNAVHLLQHVLPLMISVICFVQVTSAFCDQVKQDRDEVGCVA